MLDGRFVKVPAHKGSQRPAAAKHGKGDGLAARQRLSVQQQIDEQCLRRIVAGHPHQREGNAQRQGRLRRRIPRRGRRQRQLLFQFLQLG